MARIAVIVVSVMLATGCSFALVSGPPANHRELPVVDCTTSRLGPVLDTVFTILQVSNLVVAATYSDQKWDDLFGGEPLFKRSTAIPLYAALVAVGGAGMYYGFSRTAACRAARTELMIRATSGSGQQPGTWPPPAPAPVAPPPGPPEPPPVGPPTTPPVNP